MWYDGVPRSTVQYPWHGKRLSTLYRTSRTEPCRTVPTFRPPELDMPCADATLAVVATCSRVAVPTVPKLNAQVSLSPTL